MQDKVRRDRPQRRRVLVRQGTPCAGARPLSASPWVALTLKVADVTVKLTRESKARSPVWELMELKANRGRPLSSREKPTTEPPGYLWSDGAREKRQTKRANI